MIDIRITADKLDITDCLALTEDPRSGGNVIFIGNVRDMTNGERVLRLEFECYKPMAINEIRKIAEAAIAQFSVRNVVVHHRIGILYPTDVAVIIVVNAGHRDKVFDACRYIIDTTKQRVPIWKKEIFENGAVWVAAHP